MGEVGAREKNIENRTFWRSIICCGYLRPMPKEEDWIASQVNQILILSIGFSSRVFSNCLTALLLRIQKLYEFFTTVDLLE